MKSKVCLISVPGRRALQLGALLVLVGAAFSGASAWAQAPASVQAVEEEAEDFFTETEKAPSDAEAKAPSSGNDAEGARAQTINQNNNVVNVIINGTTATVQASGAPAATPSAAPVSAPAPVLAQGPRAEQKSSWDSWWYRDRALNSGDVVFTSMIGGWSGGPFVGLGLEAMVSGWGGIKIASALAGQTGRFALSGGRGQTRVVRVGTDLSRGSRTQSTANLTDLTFNFHLGGAQGFDLTPNVGVSHFGYRNEAAGLDQSGGSGFLRAGVGLSWFYHRFFVGADFGWYPVELFRYDLTGGRRGSVRLEEVRQPFDRGRVTLGLAMGFSL